MGKSLALRFLRSFLAGAVATMSVALVFSGSNWGDVADWLGALALAGFVGGVSGVIQAADKFLRTDWKN